MMSSSGPPTPKGVGGPTPPLVSRGSEKEWKTKIPTWGPPTSNGRGGPTPLPTQGGREEPPPTQKGREKDGRKEGGSQQGRSKTIDTTVPHEPGTTHARSKRENPPQKGQTVH